MDLDQNQINLITSRYLKKDEQGEIIEEPKEMFARVAEAVSEPEEEQEHYFKEFYRLMTEFKFLPNSPTLMNAGTRLGQLAACFVLPVPDTMEGIFEAVKNAALIHKSGGKL